jgi:hypothetical protein
LAGEPARSVEPEFDEPGFIEHEATMRMTQRHEEMGAHLVADVEEAETVEAAADVEVVAATATIEEERDDDDLKSSIC